MAEVLPELKTQYKSYYEDLSIQMVSKNSMFVKMTEELNKRMLEFGITPEQKAELESQMLTTLIPQFEQIADNKARELMKLEAEIPLKEAQTSEAVRKIQAYDDNMLNTVVEQQAGLASFAVNANSDTAQSTIDELKAKMAEVEKRVIPVDGGSVPPEPETVVSVPNGLSVTDVTTDSITLEWQPVLDATSYVLYRDGVQVASSGALSFVDLALTAVTKYAYNVKAFRGSSSSELSTTVIGVTV